MNSAAIRMEQISFSDDEVDILYDVTAFFPKGKITALVGPTGAGKTTLFKLCNGLQSPNKGKIYFENKPLESYEPTELRRRIGLALQDATMITGSIKDNLALPLTLKNEYLNEEKAIEYMNLVGLNTNLLARDVRSLSGGQRQKLSIARTLISNPEVLLLDEITASLDQVSRQDIEKLIQTINEEYGTTIIWITHSIEQARLMSDYTWVMIDGRVVEWGESSLLDAPKNKAAQLFIKGVS